MAGAALALLVGAALGAAAQEPGPGLTTPGAETAAPVTPAVRGSSDTIRSISIQTTNVFDPTVPGEDWWPFRLANRIHQRTKDEVVRRELLQGVGDQFDRLKALETERNLRNLGVFRRADIKAVPRAEGGVDLNARTQDSWTTNILLGAGTEGGDKYFVWGAQEDNLFGYDKSIMFLHSQTGPKITNEVRYTDPRFLGSRFELAPFYARTSHGDTEGVEVVKRFYSLDTPDAMGAYWNRSIDETILYKDSEDFSKFLIQDRTVSAGYAARVPSHSDFVQRLEAGWYSQRDQFAAEGTATVPGTLPAGREMDGPMLGYSWVQPQYIKETYINRMERVEDFNLGNELSVYGGFTGQALGSDRDRWLVNVLEQQGLFILPGRFALAQAGVTGRVADSKWENALFFANVNLFWKSSFVAPQTWVAHLEANTSRNLDGENQIQLGGNNGLRGYKNFSFNGGRSVLLNLEDRFFFPGEYFHLFRFGAAAFYDSGSVVQEHEGFSFKKFKSDVGLGLRFSSTRSQTGSVVRLDVAYALNQGPHGGKWVLGMKGQQAFAIFNSSTKEVRQAPRTRLFPRESTDEQ